MLKIKFDIKKIKDILARKEVISVAIILVFLFAALYSMFMSPQLYQWGIHEGDIALKDVYAPYDFTYYWGVDDSQVAKSGEAARAQIPYFTSRDRDLEDDIRFELERFFEMLEREKRKDRTLNEKVTMLKELTNKDLGDKNLKVLLEYDKLPQLREDGRKIIETIFETGYIDRDDLSYLKGKGVEKVLIYNEQDGKDAERVLASLLVNTGSMKDSVDKITCPELGVTDKSVKQALCAVVNGYAAPSLKLDERRSGEAARQLTKKGGPLYRAWKVQKNELIIEKGKRVEARHMAEIAQLRRIFRPGTTPTFFFGVLLLILLLGLIAAINLVLMYRVNFLHNTKDVAMVLIVMFFTMVVADFITRAPQPTYFVPVAAMSMMLTMLIGVNVAFLCSVLMSMFLSLLVGGGVELMLVLLTGSVVGMFAVRDARKRARILWAGLASGAAMFLGILCIGLINSLGIDFYLKDGLWGVASGIFSGFVVMGALPIFEHVFKVPTNISLLELSDLNHPLLKKLALGAPGTYHHSIMVGNLAEAACEAIGANSLKARVGAYYHDIGKIPKAEYFAENEAGAASRHENLTPSMSALILTKHVKEGVEIAKKYKLSKAITDIIQEHHGNSQMAYFYQKAIELSEPGNVPKEAEFRYPGPKPRSKESAIILLADAVEASSRSMKNPTPASIRNLVKRIINNKFIDGQFDDSDLTLRDINRIAESFVRVLAGIFHTRTNYPGEPGDLTGGMLEDDTENFGRKQKQKQRS